MHQTMGYQNIPSYELYLLVNSNFDIFSTHAEPLFVLYWPSTTWTDVVSLSTQPAADEMTARKEHGSDRPFMANYTPAVRT